MRVAHIVGAFSKLSETFIYDLVVASARGGIDTHVLTSEHVNAHERPFDPVHVLELLPEGHPERALLQTMNRLDQLPDDQPDNLLVREAYHRLIERLQPDIIHAHFGELGWLIAPVAQRLGIPLIVSFHGYDVSRLPRHPRWRQRYAEMFGVMACAVVVSERMRRDVIALGVPSECIKIIHVGKDIHDYPQKTPTYPIRNWISVGRLVEKKGHADCIRAFARARLRQPFTLTIVGDGSQQAELETLIRDHQLSDCVQLVGGIPHERVKQMMLQADAFILCSKTAANGDKEGIPTVLMEAQAIGLPCISTTHAGIAEAIPTENQWMLAPEGDIDGIACLIERVSELDGATLSDIVMRGRQKIADEFSLAASVAQHSALYHAYTH